MRRKRSRDVSTPAIVEFLRTRAWPTRTLEVIETHFAWVFLTATFAYKLKKPLRAPYMDYRTIARRKRGCDNEVRLNRRLARSVYLGVVPIVRKHDGSFSLGRGRRIVDWVVKMRRLPTARMLDHAIVEHTVAKRDVQALSAMLSKFFQHARPEPMRSKAYLARLRLRARQNGRQLCARDLRLNRQRVKSVIRAQLEFIAQAGTLLGNRGLRLIDGHGDLRPEHVYLGSKADAACVIDCLEFDRDLRRLDPAEELAFLALECTRLGGNRLASHLLRDVRRKMSDSVPDALIHFYVSQRAVVRAKIAAWHLRDAQFADRPRFWRRLANNYLRDAQYYARLALLEPTRPLLVDRHRPTAEQRRYGLTRH